MSADSLRKAAASGELVRPVGDQGLPVRAPLHHRVAPVEPGVALVAGLEARRGVDADQYADLLERIDYLEDSLAALQARVERDETVPWAEVRE
jgi:hypothetical protein